MSPAIPIVRAPANALRKALGLPVVLSSLLACLTFWICSTRFADPDTWWHLKLGQEVWQTHAIPSLDSWSYTVNGHPFVAHEWLGQVSLFAAFHWFGYTGLQVWLCLFSAAIAVASFMLCYRYSGDAVAAAVGGFLALFFGSIGMSMRPQVIGYLLLVIELLILHRAYTERARALWWLPALFALWVNCHGSYSLGLFIFAAAGVCWWSSADRTSRRTLAASFALSCGALLVNPIGWKLLLYPIDTMFHQKDGLTFVTEWLPLSTQDIRGLALVFVLGAMGVAALTGRARASLFELLVFVPVTYLAIQHERLVFVFGIVCAPLAARMIAARRRLQPPAPDHLPANAFLVILCAVLSLALIPSAARSESRVEGLYPVKAVQFLRQAKLKGPMMHEYIWGGYLIWALPEYKVFIDGRSDVYDWAGVVARYRDWYLLHADPAQLLNDYHIGFCLLPAGSAQANVVRRMTGWKQVYQDEVAAIFVRQ